MHDRRFGLILIGLACVCTGDAGLAVPPPEILDAMQPGWDAALEIDGDSGSAGKGLIESGNSSATTAFTSHKVTLVSRVPPSAFPSGSSGANEVWGYVSPGGREYGILGMRRGTGFVDITDPANPVIRIRRHYRSGQPGHRRRYSGQCEHDLARYGHLQRTRLHRHRR